MKVNGSHPVFLWRDAVLHSTTLRLSERIVGLALAAYMNADTLGGAHPGPARLAKDTGLTARTVQRALAALVEQGWLEKAATGGSSPGGRRVATVYRGLTHDILPRVEGGPTTPVSPVPTTGLHLTHDTGDVPTRPLTRQELGEGWHTPVNEEGLALLRRQFAPGRDQS